MHAHRFHFPGGFCLHAALLLVLLSGSAVLALGQASEPGEAKPLMYLPLRVPEGAWWNSAGLTSVSPPAEIVEEMQVRWPAFDYHTLYGLPQGFSMDGRAAVQVLQNRFALRPRWASKVGPVSFSLGYDVAYWFGALTVGQFDTKGHGWEGSPNISVGYRFGKIAATVKAEMLMDYSVVTYQGDLQTSSNRKTNSGYGFTIALEQPFYKDQYLTLAFRAMYTKFYWETWSLFATFDRNLFYPEIIVGFVL